MHFVCICIVLAIEQSLSFDINNAGTIIGSYLDANGIRTGFSRTTDGVYRTYSVPGANGVRLLGVSDGGHFHFEFPDTPDGIHITSDLRQADGATSALE